MSVEATERRRAEMEGRAARAAYVDALPRLLESPPSCAGELPLDAVAFSCRRDLPEQVVSIRSLLRSAGAPSSFTVISDGSHSGADRDLLAAVHPCVRLIDWRAVARPEMPEPVLRYAERHAMGRKLAVELSLPLHGPTLYADADVHFFPGARELAAVAAGGMAARYLPDCGPYLDERLLVDPCERRDPVNGGVFLLHEPLRWEGIPERLATLPGVPGFFAEQTLLHLAMHASGAQSLDPTRYIVSRSDELRLADDHAGPDIALRHYTTPVRHKLWRAVARGAAGGAPEPSSTGAGRGPDDPLHGGEQRPERRRRAPAIVAGRARVGLMP